MNKWSGYFIILCLFICGCSSGNKDVNIKQKLFELVRNSDCNKIDQWRLRSLENNDKYIGQDWTLWSMGSFVEGSNPPKIYDYFFAINNSGKIVELHVPGSISNIVDKSRFVANVKNIDDAKKYYIYALSLIDKKFDPVNSIKGILIDLKPDIKEAVIRFDEEKKKIGPPIWIETDSTFEVTYFPGQGGENIYDLIERHVIIEKKTGIIRVKSITHIRGIYSPLI